MWHIKIEQMVPHKIQLFIRPKILPVYQQNPTQYLWKSVVSLSFPTQHLQKHTVKTSCRLLTSSSQNLIQKASFFHYIPMKETTLLVNSANNSKGLSCFVFFFYCLANSYFVQMEKLPYFVISTKQAQRQIKTWILHVWFFTKIHVPIICA